MSISIKNIVSLFTAVFDPPPLLYLRVSTWATLSFGPPKQTARIIHSVEAFWSRLLAYFLFPGRLVQLLRVTVLQRFGNIRGWIQQSSEGHIHHRINSMRFAASFILNVVDVGSGLGSHLLFYAKTSRLITIDNFVYSWLPIWTFDGNVFLDLHIQNLSEVADCWCAQRAMGYYLSCG